MRRGSGRAARSLKAAELHRVFLERVPLDRLARRECLRENARNCPGLAEMIRAWSALLMFREQVLLSVQHAVSRWYAEELTPVVQVLRDADLVPPGEGDGDACVRPHDRCSLVRAHVWTEEVLDCLRKARKK